MFPFRHASWQPQVPAEASEESAANAEAQGVNRRLQLTWQESDADHDMNQDPNGIAPHQPPRAVSDTHDLTARFARMMDARLEQAETRRGVFASSSNTRRHSARSRNCAAEKRHARRARVLQRSIDAVRDQVQALEQSRDLIVSRFLTLQTNRTGVAIETCRDYFRYFAAGYDSTLPLTGSRQAMETFIHSAATEDIVCREFKGITNMLRQWETYTRYHGHLAVRLASITLVEEEDDLISICCVVEIRAIVVEATIRHLYPALYAEAERDPQAKRFVDGILGKPLLLSFDKVLHFNAHGKIFAHESRAHLASALLDAVQNPMAAMKMLGAALLTEDGHWKIAGDDNVQAREDFHDIPKRLL